MFPKYIHIYCESFEHTEKISLNINQIEMDTIIPIWHLEKQSYLAEKWHFTGKYRKCADAEI